MKTYLPKAGLDTHGRMTAEIPERIAHRPHGRKAFYLTVMVALSLLACALLAAAHADAGADDAKTAQKARGSKVTLNFVDVELPAVVKFISEITGKNFIFDDKLKGKITIIAPTKLTADDAFSLFTSVLELKGFTVVPSGVDAYKIVPSSEIKQRGIEISTARGIVNESYVARLISLRHIAADDVLRLIQPIISKDGYVSVFGPGNLLLVIDAGLNVEKVLSIIEIIDQQSTREAPDILFLRNSGAEAVAKILNEGYGRPRTAPATGLPSSSETAKAVADPRLNAVILFGDKGSKESMKSIVSLLDVPAPDAMGKVNVVFLEHADATELAKVLEGMIKGAQTQKQAVQGAAPVTPFEAVGGVTITPDKASNSLIIVASPADYQNLLKIIRQLDHRRRQVFVEALIAEVSINNLVELGVKWRATATKDGKPIVIGGVGQIDQATIQSIITGLTGLTVGGLGKYYTIPKDFIAGATSDVTVPGMVALLSLSEFKDAVNVLATPQILTSDNKEAEVMVGQNIPLVSQRSRDVTTANTYLNSIERRDVGITLKITPQISEGDHVKLDVYQEISAPIETSDVIYINVGPSITKRSTKTTVIVKDSQTVVIGGLISERTTGNVQKVPFLGDLPVLGWLFKLDSRKTEKINLLVFITPHIVKNAETLGRITTDKQREFMGSQQAYAEGELLVRFREGVSRQTAESIIAKAGASMTRLIETINLYSIRLRQGQTIEQAIAEFSAMPEVLYAEPNYRIMSK